MALLLQEVMSQKEDKSDEKLVLLARTGDQVALETLFHRYQMRINLYLTRMVGADGGELTQETFIKAWKSLPSLRDNSNFSNWLYRIATNVAYDYQRRQQRIPWLPWELLKRTSGKHTTGTTLEQQVAEKDILNQALAQISPRYRACVILQIVEEMPQKQIAALLGIKENSVSKYVSRGMEELRRAYRRLNSEHKER